MNQVYFNIEGWGGGWLDGEGESAKFIHVKCQSSVSMGACSECKVELSSKTREMLWKLWDWTNPLRVENANSNQ